MRKSPNAMRKNIYPYAMTPCYIAKERRTHNK